MHSEENAILLHDIRAAMLNHSGLHKEVHESLMQLTEVLQILLPVPEASREGICESQLEVLRQQVDEILSEDVEQCMPMLQLSSDKLSELLSRMMSDVIQKKKDNMTSTRSN